MPEPEEWLIQKIKQEIAEKRRLRDVKTFRIEQFIKTYKRPKMGVYTWKSRPDRDKERE
ncbi:hypothetical protein EZQ59_004497 [Escherichia coli]|uniref:hypothetical protein n=1 Tax=Escherichia coli TaxID=562 RepID=UPI0016B95CC6|nr:hypothetical protein [Escherichia coli]EES1714192.1 hypothetical protein [Escherichia coli]EES5579655.1 hypothetical protein [Escherichia coli]EES5762580.1 hypothetical protein [Escherichia coli]EES5964245.1 hypothetical protein [Escherichia coli]EES6318443.1 hypothetical protein [Escherichia coli]